jgi:2-keto-4-pentenoate hydratase/2-oxohepta-3-ene-1,7-dioic acid hydratase in catechol pathway
MVRLVSFSANNGPVKIGAEAGDNIVDLTAALGISSMKVLLAAGDEGIKKASEAAAAAKVTVPKSSVKILAPVPDPENVICIGMNYVDHCTEQNFPIPTEPLLFSKSPSTIVADGDNIYQHPWVKELDFEVELAIIVGVGGRHIPKEQALKHVAGWSVAHDVSARDWQFKRNGGQWYCGKSFDGYTPLGPALVTKDEAGDIHNKRIRCLLNGKAVQDSSTNQMIFKTEDVISWVSTFTTLKAGDVIITGTPPGVGCFRKPQPLWLKAGDVVTVEVEGLGAITNKVVAEVPKYTPTVPSKL